MDDDLGMSDDQFVEWALNELDKMHPCPVDEFEDKLAAELGLRRHPSMSREEWRRLRVEFIESFDRSD